jgi:hypothetical protein
MLEHLSNTLPKMMGGGRKRSLYLSDIPVSISTIEDSNVLGGFFRLEYGGQVTDPIPIDADEAQMQIALEDLSSAGEVIVSRSDGDDQNGYTWTIQFASDENGGDLDDLIVHSEDVSSTSNAGGASVQVVPGGTDGSYISGTFTVEFGKSSCLQQSILSFFQLL